MGRTPVEDIQKSFSGQIDAHRYEEGIDKQAENQTELPEETNLLLLVDLCLNHTQCDKTTIFATNWCVHPQYHTQKVSGLVSIRFTFSNERSLGLGYWSTCCGSFSSESLGEFLVPCVVFGGYARTNLFHCFIEVSA